VNNNIYTIKLHILTLLIIFYFPIQFYISNLHNIRNFNINSIFIIPLILSLFYILSILINSKLNKKLYFFLLFIFNFWFIQNLYTFIKDFYLLTNLSSWFSIFILFILSYFLVFLSKFSVYQNLFICFLLVNILFLFSYQSYKNFDSIYKYKDKYISGESSSVSINDIKINFNNEKLPNIFFIIPDQMASFNTLENKFDYQTDKIKEKFESKDYTYLDNSKSSFNITFLTLASIFELNYLNLDKGSNLNHRGTYYPGLFNFKEPLLLKILSKAGYDNYLIGNFMLPCYENYSISCTDHFFKDYFVNITQLVINNYAIQKSNETSLLGKFLSYLRIYIESNNQDLIKYVNSSNSISILGQLIESKTNFFNEGGKFFFVHHLGPHNPFRDKDCKLLLNQNPTKENYISSVDCTFNLIEELDNKIDLIDNENIVLFQSDHGPSFEYSWSSNLKNLSANMLNERLNIFNLIKLPEKCKSGFNFDNGGSITTTLEILYCVGIVKDSIEIKRKSFISHYEDDQRYGNVLEVSF